MRPGLDSSARHKVSSAQYLVAVAGMALLLVTGLLVWVRATTPSDGSVVQLSNAPWDGDRLRLTFVLDSSSGLRAGDVVTRINGQPLSSALERGAVARGELREGDRLTYTVVRQGVERNVDTRLGAFPLRAFVATNVGALVLVASMLVVASFVFYNRPADPAAQALLLIATFAACGITAWLLGDQVVRLVDNGPSMADLVGELALALLWGAIVHFTLVAPGTGLRVGPQALLTAYLVPIGLHLAYLAVSLPAADSRLEAAGRIVQVSQVPSYVFPFVIPVLMAISYRSCRDEAARRRLRWVLITFGLASLAWVGLGVLPSIIHGRPVVSERYILLIFLPCPLALGAAILRYRLFDIEVILRRSLLYGSLTVCVLAIYLGTTWLFSRAIGPRPGLVALLGSGIVALSVQPIRSYLQRRIGHLIYGERDDPYEVIAQLGHIDAAAAPRSVLLGVVETLAQTLRLPYAAIKLRTPDGQFQLEADYGHPRGTPLEVPLTHRDALVGRLLLDVGPGREPFGPADQRLLDTLTRQVSAAASTVLLTAELQRSRERLIMAREEERRRLRRDLHDGLGPTLAGVVLQVGAAKALVDRDPPAVRALLTRLRGEVQGTIEEIRRLVYKLRPPALDELGLVGALREQATQFSQDLESLANADGLTVLVQAPQQLPTLPAAVEVAAYRIATEAMTNAARHAQAHTCHVLLTLGADGALELEVCDDGRGLSDGARAGVGLRSMQERAAELGGTCTVEPAVGRGTRVHARLPLSALKED